MAVPSGTGVEMDVSRFFDTFQGFVQKNRGDLRKIYRENTSGSTKLQMVGQIQFPTAVCFLSLKFFFSDSSEICRLQTVLKQFA